MKSTEHTCPTSYAAFRFWGYSQRTALFHTLMPAIPASHQIPFDLEEVLKLDGYLKPELPEINSRFVAFKKWRDTIDEHEGGYDTFTKGYEKFGFNIKESGDVVYREWAPNATSANLVGDFSEHSFLLQYTSVLQWIHTCRVIDSWDRESHPMKVDSFGIWEITLAPKVDGECAIPHDSKVKVR